VERTEEERDRREYRIERNGREWKGIEGRGEEEMDASGAAPPPKFFALEPPLIKLK
jgi:hypothetical protein